MAAEPNDEGRSSGSPPSKRLRTDSEATAEALSPAEYGGLLAEAGLGAATPPEVVELVAESVYIVSDILLVPSAPSAFSGDQTPGFEATVRRGYGEETPLLSSTPLLSGTPLLPSTPLLPGTPLQSGTPLQPGPPTPLLSGEQTPALRAVPAAPTETRVIAERGVASEVVVSPNFVPSPYASPPLCVSLDAPSEQSECDASASYDLFAGESSPLETGVDLHQLIPRTPADAKDALTASTPRSPREISPGRSEAGSDHSSQSSDSPPPVLVDTTEDVVEQTQGDRIPSFEEWRRARQALGLLKPAVRPRLPEVIDVL